MALLCIHVRRVINEQGQQGFRTNGMPERPTKSLPPIVSAIAETMGAKGLT
jgi:hypothetical protein